MRRPGRTATVSAVCVTVGAVPPSAGGCVAVGSRHVRRRVPGVRGCPCRRPRDVAPATPQWRCPPCRRLRRTPPGAGEECRLWGLLFVLPGTYVQERLSHPAPATARFHRDAGLY